MTVVESRARRVLAWETTVTRAVIVIQARGAPPADVKAIGAVSDVAVVLARRVTLAADEAV
jgi:hypothetical protein